LIKEIFFHEIRTIEINCSCYMASFEFIFETAVYNQMIFCIDNQINKSFWTYIVDVKVRLRQFKFRDVFFFKSYLLIQSS